MSFEDLGLHEPLRRAVYAAGYRQATPIQRETIPILLSGRDLMGCAQTGTGKTAAFALPILQRLTTTKRLAGSSDGADRANPARHIRTLVLAPTRELAAQIDASFRTYGKFTGLRSTAIYGGVNQRPQVRALRAKVDILVATPGRLLDLMQQGFVDLQKVEILVLDEADQMLDMGFLPALKQIEKALPRRRQTLMFSATMPEAIRRLAQNWLQRPATVQVTPVAAPAECASQSVYLVESSQKPELLKHLLRAVPGARTLVFARTKHGADKLEKLLMRAGIHAKAIHGNKSQNARMRVLEQFKSSTPPVLVATDLAARGLDVKDIAHVINYELPEVPETYVHRIGRTARAGASGQATSFCSREERCRLQRIERLTRQTLRIETDHPEYAERPKPAPRTPDTVQECLPAERSFNSSSEPKRSSRRPAAIVRGRGPRRQRQKSRRRPGLGAA